ncbi:enoyl-CoA hydratase/isomerase family protein [Streptomyces sp. NPDC059477]|uniref:enoyl-CoA hydratase/isomerase family protein n=1 Tax=Streptomyces sp. NPDC059477 TaxID=3346847 RepID=UPI0036AA9790
MTGDRSTPARIRVDEAEPGITVVTLDRPGRRNALDTRTLDELTRAFEGIDARAVVLTGTGPAFCAGYDLHSVAGPGFEPRAEELIAHPTHAVFDAIRNAAFPVIAAITGPALGGGLELACCCDARVATRGASFGIPAGDLGLVYSDTGIRRFASVWGGSLTREMLLLGRYVDAHRAWQAGAVTEITDERCHVEAALRLARRAARLAPVATAANKRIVGDVLDPTPLRPSCDAAALRRACFAPTGELRTRVEAFVQGSRTGGPCEEKQAHRH